MIYSPAIPATGHAVHSNDSGLEIFFKKWLRPTASKDFPQGIFAFGQRFNLYGCRINLLANNELSIDY